MMTLKHVVQCATKRLNESLRQLVETQNELEQDLDVMKEDQPAAHQLWKAVTEAKAAVVRAERLAQDLKERL
jgi:hypothetical protein